jgi:hypothetical protein
MPERIAGQAQRVPVAPGQSEGAVRERIRALNVEIARVNARAAEGPPTRLAPLDVDTIVAEWRAARSRSR